MSGKAKSEPRFTESMKQLDRQVKQWGENLSAAAGRRLDALYLEGKSSGEVTDWTQEDVEEIRRKIQSAREIKSPTSIRRKWNPARPCDPLCAKLTAATM